MSRQPLPDRVIDLLRSAVPNLCSALYHSNGAGSIYEELEQWAPHNEDFVPVGTGGVSRLLASLLLR